MIEHAGVVSVQTSYAQCRIVLKYLLTCFYYTEAAVLLMSIASISKFAIQHSNYLSCKLEHVSIDSRCCLRFVLKLGGILEYPLSHTHVSDLLGNWYCCSFSAEIVRSKLSEWVEMIYKFALYLFIRFNTSVVPFCSSRG